MSESLPQEAGENSLWLDSAVPAPDCDVLQGDLSVDVLVVGAGFTGISTALHLAERGVSVALIEAGAVGHGGSGRNAGLVNAGIWKDPEHVATVLGAEQAERFNLALRDSPSEVFGLVERLGLDCQASRCGTIHIAHSRAGFDYLQSRHRQLRDLGAEVELIDSDESVRLSGSPAYAFGGIHHPAAGTIQPLSYVREMARAAIEAGVQVFEKSALKTLQRVNERWRAAAGSGSIDAEQVVVATNAYSDNSQPGLKESTLPVYIFQCATPPLPEARLRELIPERQGLWDTHTLLTSSRIDQRGRLVMSFPGRLQSGQRESRQAWATRRRDLLFPSLRGTSWEFFWTGRVGVTDSKLFRIQKLAPGLYAPAGYNGRGIGTGTVVGKYLAAAIASNDYSEFPFPIDTLYREKWWATRSAYYDYGTLALQLCSHRL